MSQDPSPRMRSLNASPASVVAGGAALGLLTAAAAVAYLRTQRNAGAKLTEAIEKGRGAVVPSFGLKGKWALAALIRVIEHDSSRKVLLAVLKSIAKRAK